MQRLAQPLDLNRSQALGLEMVAKEGPGLFAVRSWATSNRRRNQKTDSDRPRLTFVVRTGVKAACLDSPATSSMVRLPCRSCKSEILKNDPWFSLEWLWGKGASWLAQGADPETARADRARQPIRREKAGFRTVPGFMGLYLRSSRIDANGDKIENNSSPGKGKMRIAVSLP